MWQNKHWQSGGQRRGYGNVWMMHWREVTDCKGNYTVHGCGRDGGPSIKIINKTQKVSWPQPVGDVTVGCHSIHSDSVYLMMELFVAELCLYSEKKVRTCDTSGSSRRSLGMSACLHSVSLIYNFHVLAILAFTECTGTTLVLFSIAYEIPHFAKQKSPLSFMVSIGFEIPTWGIHLQPQSCIT